jgi:GNAT superfamily N-acetyltransferase
MSKFEKIELENYKIEPLKRKNLKETLELYKKLHNGNGISLEKRLMLKFVGSKFCYILVSEKGEVFGLGLYYFNKKDIIEKTIHVGYTGLKAGYRGMGIGTKARRYALQHFAKIDFLRGVSSRVSLDNIPALRGNIKLGFEIKEKYWDENEQKERVYLVCDLDKYRVNKK